MKKAMVSSHERSLQRQKARSRHRHRHRHRQLQLAFINNKHDALTALYPIPVT